MRHSLQPESDMRSEESVTKAGHPHDTSGIDLESHDVNLPGSDATSEISAQAGVISAQAGVKRIEAVSKAWTKTSLIVAYVTYV